MLRIAQATVFTWLVIVSQALAQATTAPATPAPAQPGPATPTQTASSGVTWLWLLVIAALIAAALWYFMRLEPRRVSRRPFGLGQAAKARTSAWA